MKKKISGLILLLSVIVTLLSPNTINASELDDNMGTRAGPIVYKTNVQNYEEWGHMLGYLIMSRFLQDNL